MVDENAAGAPKGMGRRQDFTDISPFDPNWRQLFKDRENTVRIIFEPEWGVPKYPRKGWIVEDLLPRGYLALLAGKPKAGKTNLAATLAHAVSQGLPFAGMNTVQAPVLYFAAEESAEEWERSLWPYLPKGREGLWVGHASNFRIDHDPDLWNFAATPGSPPLAAAGKREQSSQSPTASGR